MNITKCENGHFYDGDTYEQCPHCNPNTISDNADSVSDNAKSVPDIPLLGMMRMDSNDNFMGVDPIGKNYVLLDPEQTAPLYSDVLQLTVEGTGETIQSKKAEFNVGCHQSCDFRFESSYKYISRMHATFFYEHNIWFLKDNDSTNGTWLNGVRLQPGKKYQLAKNDTIDFAHSEKMIFYKSKVQPPKYPPYYASPDVMNIKNNNICKKCGYVSSANAKFCTQCGTPVENHV